MTPTEFWQLTPRELALASDAFAVGRDEAPRRRELAELMRRYPDQVAHKKDTGDD